MTNKISRRQAMKQSLLGAAGFALLNPSDLLAEPRTRAKSVIQIWMWGGPSHLDTFDPKPEAGYDYCGPLKNSIPTNVNGIRIGESLPLLAKQADKYTIIRSMTHGVNAHETASYITQTGRKPSRMVYPSAGAVVSLFKGYDHGYKGVAPPYIVLTTPQGRFSEAGLLGQKYKPFSTGGDPSKTPFLVEGIVAKGISDQRQQRRRELLRDLDTLGALMRDNARFKEHNRCEDKAYNMMFGDAKKLFDLSTEGDNVRDMYGRNEFGQSCLMARRLVENSVPYITINYKGWDTHKQHFDIMKRKLPEMDQGMSALLRDLSDRGLLNSTIVWWSGEFGRSPKVQWGSPWNGGRSHFGRCFSAVVAGGGFNGGQVVGASNATGEEVKDRPVYPKDVLASIYELMGINPSGPLPNPKGLELQVLPSSQPIREVMVS